MNSTHFMAQEILYGGNQLVWIDEVFQNRGFDGSEK
jgi:hypothetical protein